MKALYSQLRSLIPNQNSKRKLSISSTVSRVLKYIPELHNEIRKLSRERAELLAGAGRSISESSLKISKPASSNGAEELIHFIDPAPPSTALGSPDPIVTVNAALGDSQMIITIYNCRVGFRFSTLLVLFEKEGLDVFNASTFISSDKVCHNLHLKMFARRSEVDTNRLQRKLLMVLYNKTLSTTGVC